jgi:hypothetical protein
MTNIAHKSTTENIQRRPAYRTLPGWALGTLIEHGAVAECEHHGHRRDRTDPEAWNRAREAAWNSPFPGSTPEACLKALDEVMRWIGDSCPDC